MSLAAVAVTSAVAVMLLVPSVYTVAFVHVVFRGVAATVTWIGTGNLLSIAISLIVAGLAWPVAGSLRRSERVGRWWEELRQLTREVRSVASLEGQDWPRSRLRLARSRAAIPLLWARLWPTPLEGGVRAHERSARSGPEVVWRSLLRPLLLLAIAASFVWMVWHRPGPWRIGVLLALAVLLAVRRLSPRGHRLAPVAVRLRSSARDELRSWGVPRLQRRWNELPTHLQEAVTLIVLLNLLVGEDAGGLGPFLAIAALDLLLLGRMTETASPARSHTVPVSQSLPPVSAPRPGDADRRERERELVTGRRAPTPAGAPAPDAPDGPHRRWVDMLQPPLAILAGTAATGWIAYAHPGTWLVAGVVVVGLSITMTVAVEREQAITMVLGVGVAAAAIDYMSWRFQVTNWDGWWIAVPLLFAEGLGAIHILGYQLTIWPRRTPPLAPSEDPRQAPIFIFVPTLGEGVGVLKPTLEGCLAARKRYLTAHPGAQVTIAVCNDGRAAGVPDWSAVNALARTLGVRCVTREKGGGAKAGNLEHARQVLGATGDALLAIFDADQVPSGEFLLKTVPPFGDPRVGWVQTGQYYANAHNPVSRWADDQQSMFYNVLCPGKAAMNAAFICGTNVVIRAQALDEIGGLPQDSVTEDFAASIILHPRWRSVYLTDVLATGLGPLDLASYFRQQGRWALGTLAVLRSHWRDILLPRKQGLRLGQRVQYFLACTHYLCGLRDLIYLISPMLFIATGIPAVNSATLTQYLWHFLPYGLLGLLGLWYSARGVTGLRGIIIGFGSFPALIASLLAVIVKRKVGFAVTSKRRGASGPFARVRIHIILLLLCVGALVWATQVRGQQATSLFISVLWVTYSLLLLISFIWLAVADASAYGVGARAVDVDEVAAKLPYPAKLRRRAAGLRPAWNLGAATLMATPLLIVPLLGSLPIFAGRSASPFAIPREALAAPYVGLSLPTSLLSGRPAMLQRELAAPISIIGRTQDVEDRFDAAWAKRLAAHGARPWVTLEFGVFGPHQQRPLDTNLPAILNGLHDRDIVRWAQEIRAFGRPVYLTILRHADKNWALSSGVTGGGIPQDVPMVWRHVRAIFRAEGATNVAWVWAPADPAHDQAFAPPSSSIDVVLQSFVDYPGTRWGDPQTVLTQLTRRYPAKPLFVEASVDGSPEAKAAWLGRLGRALDACRQLYAFLYHEGGPALRLTPAEVKKWSLASDQSSLTAARSLAASLETRRGFR